MKAELIAAVICIMAALVLYTIGVFAERKSHMLRKWHVIVFWAGLVFDTTGTSLMGIIADNSEKSGVTLHGVTGFIAIVLMLFHAVWATVTLTRGNEKQMQTFHRFSLFVWMVWLFSFLTGMIIGMG